jgi:outer membrane protein TolC
MRKKILIAFTLIFLFPLYLSAELKPDYSDELGGLIKEALKNNLRLTGLEKNIHSIKEKSYSAGRLPDPVAGISILNLPADSFSFKKEGMTQKQIFVSQKVPWLSKLDTKAEIELKKSETAKAVMNKEKISTALAISRLYYDLTAERIKIKKNRELINMLKKIIENLDSGYVSGNTLRQDILQADIELEKLKDKNIKSIRKANTLEFKINEILNSDSFKKIKTENIKSFPDTDLNIKKTTQAALNKNPDIIILKRLNNQKETSTKLTRKEFYPDFEFKAAYSQRESDSSGNSRPDFFSFTAAFSIPFMNKKADNKDYLSAQLDEESSLYKLNSLKLSITHKLNEKIESIKSNKERFLLYKNTVIPLGNELSETSMDDYMVGRTDFDTMIKAQMQLIEQKFELEEILIETKRLKTELLSITGSIIPETILNSYSSEN